MTSTSLYSNMLASDIIAISNLGPLQSLELPTSMNYLMNSMITHIPRTTPPQVPPKVALTCQQRTSTRSILPTSIGLLMSPPLPLGNLPLPLPLPDPPPAAVVQRLVATSSICVLPICSCLLNRTPSSDSWSSK